MSNEFSSLSRKVNQYNETVANTLAYRKIWDDSLRDRIMAFLKSALKEVGLKAEVSHRSDVENLEALVLSLGDENSGLYQLVNATIKRHMIKHNGSLVYQQLFNGKIIVMIQYPFIENYGQPKQPKTVAIYRPEELSEPFLLRHLEEFITEITGWEDLDDDEPNKKIGFELNLNQPKEAG